MTYPIEAVRADYSAYPGMGFRQLAERHNLTMAEVAEIISHGRVSRETEEWAEGLRKRLGRTDG